MEAGAAINLSANVEPSHKNKLQQFVQRASLCLPEYHTYNEGPPHQPQFRSTVIVDGASYVSPCTFTRRKEAEQYVAKLALDCILMKIKQDGVPVIYNDIAFCKSILHEYATKLKLDLPTYATSKLGGRLPFFTATVNFDGKYFRGACGKSKKEAEQLGARAVIEWILAQSDTSINMAEIIKAKSKLADSFSQGPSSIVLPGNDMPLNVLVNNLDDTIVREKDLPVTSTNNQALVSVPAAENSVQPLVENPSDRQISVVCAEPNGDGSNVPTLRQGNQHDGSQPVNSVVTDSLVQPNQELPPESPLRPEVVVQPNQELPPESPLRPDVVVQPNQEVPSESPSTPQAEGQSENSGTGTAKRRLSNRKRSGSNAKKIRPTE